MNNQEAMNRVCEGLLVTQRAPAITDMGTCKYRTDDGRRCAIGLLLNDQTALDLADAGYGGWQGVVSRAHEDEPEALAAVAEVEGVDADLLKRLQFIHDADADRIKTVEWLDNVANGLTRCCEDFGLEKPACLVTEYKAACERMRKAYGED